MNDDKPEAPSEPEEKLVLELYFQLPLHGRNGKRIPKLTSEECTITDHGDTLEIHVPAPSSDGKQRHDLYNVPLQNIAETVMRGVHLPHIAKLGREQAQKAREMQQRMQQAQALNAPRIVVPGGGNGQA